MADTKWCKLRSGTLFAFTKTAPIGGVRCNADGSPLSDDAVQAVDGVSQVATAALVDQEPAQPAQVGDVPTGPTLAIVEWVGDDPQRAALALQVEGERTRQRSGVISALAHFAEATQGA